MTLREEHHFALANHLQFKRYIWDAIRKTFPELTKKRNKRLLLLLGYLLRAKRSPNSTIIPLSAVMLSRLYAHNPDADRDHHLHVAADIKRLEQITGCEIKLTKYDKNGEKAREVYSFRLNTKLATTIYPTTASELLRGGLVNLVNGRAIPENEIKIYMQAQFEEADRLNAECPIEEHREWLWYMNHYITEKKLRPTKAGFEAAYQYLDTANMSNSRRNYFRDVVNEISYCPHIPYRWVQKSPRLFGFAGRSYPHIEMAVRTRLLPDVIELDLSSCQLAIFAKLGNIESLLNFLRTRQKVWKYLIEQCDLPMDDYEQLKPTMKILIYEILFGCAEHQLFWRKDGLDRETLKPFTPEVQERFRAIPIVADLLMARNAMLKQIRHDRGMIDAYCRFIQIVKHEIDAKSVLSQVVQSYEMLTLQPFRELTITEGKQTGAWDCLCWQHDGVTIDIRNRSHTAITILERIIAAVNQQARALGFETRFEISYQPKWYTALLDY